MMKFAIALSLTSSLALASSNALSADLVDETPVAPVETIEVPVFTWSGGYLGVAGGGGWADGDFTTGGVTASDSFNGGIFGAFAGWNWQMDNNFVVGLEGDVDYNWNDNTFAPGVEAGTDWAGSVRGRLGYAVDRTLIYGTAGWAVTRGFVDNGVTEDTQTFNGWTACAGVDQAFTDNMFGRLEYRYTDFSDEDVFGGATNADFDQHTVKVGLGFKF